MDSTEEAMSCSELTIIRLGLSSNLFVPHVFGK